MSARSSANPRYRTIGACVWVLIRPGITTWPVASMVSAALNCRATASAVSTATMSRPSIATAPRAQHACGAVHRDDGSAGDDQGDVARPAGCPDKIVSGRKPERRQTARNMGSRISYQDPGPHPGRSPRSASVAWLLSYIDCRAAPPGPASARARCARHASGGVDEPGDLPSHGGADQPPAGLRGHARRADGRDPGPDAARAGRRAPGARWRRRRAGAPRRPGHARRRARVDSDRARGSHRTAARRNDGGRVAVLLEAAGRLVGLVRADDRSDAGDRRQRRRGPRPDQTCRRHARSG